MQIGQQVVLRFAAFKQRTTPEIDGTVTLIAADISDRPAHRRELLHRPDRDPAEEMARLGDVKLVPGMPVEASSRPASGRSFSYLLKPLHDQLMRAFRERG